MATTRRPTTTAFLSLAALLAVLPTPAQAQLSLKGAVDDVLGWVNLKAEEYETIPEMGQWGMTFGWFAEGEEKELRFTATKGKAYFIAGGGDENSNDLDICVYDSKGTKIECDTATDDVPLVTFTASQTGTYRATLKAYDIDGSTSFAGMVLLRKKG